MIKQQKNGLISLLSDCQAAYRVSSQLVSSSILILCGIIADKSVPESHHWTLSITLICNQQNRLWSGFLSHCLE